MKQQLVKLPQQVQEVHLLLGFFNDDVGLPLQGDSHTYLTGKYIAYKECLLVCVGHMSFLTFQANSDY